MTIATSGRVSVERLTGMNWSPVTSRNNGHRCFNDIPGSKLCEIGLDQITKLGGNLRALSEPQLKPAHRLMQQHAQPIGGPESARPPRSQQRRPPRHLYQVC